MSYLLFSRSKKEGGVISFSWSYSSIDIFGGNFYDEIVIIIIISKWFTKMLILICSGNRTLHYHNRPTSLTQ